MLSFYNSAMAAGPFGGTCMAIGAFVVALVVKKAVLSTYMTFFRPAKDLKKLGAWAVVTGATDGIGKAYAFELAKMGMNLVIISRTESKLQDVKKEIDAKNYGIEVKYLVCDYSNFDTKARSAIEKELKDMDIGVLINNVGASYRYPRYFHELPREEMQHLMTMNIDSTVWMTEMVLKGMVERKKGTVVNLSSAAARNYAVPLLSEYSACKAFIEKFTTSLNAEYIDQGITFQCQSPFFVATKLAKMRKSFLVPSPKEYVDCAIKWVGYPQDIVSPFWVHALLGWIVLYCLPTSFTVNYFFNDMKNTRKRGMKKDANGGVSDSNNKKKE